MSLTKLLGTEYEPTAAFSFEFFKRNRKNKSFSNADKIGEIFFLLPPEEYSMTEGYKVTVTKTAAGGWVDDFGNDFKKIRISGSLYSFYTGYPVTKPNLNSGALSGVKNFAKEVGNKVVTAGKRLAESTANIFGVSIPGLKGLSGIEEFFKLRYIVSRFRDVYINENGDKYKFKAPSLKEVDEIASYSKDGPLYDNIAIVYHDYDDNNHYEIVFENFTMRRSKEDPFTVNYVIEMVGLREVNSVYLGLGKITTKESPFEVLQELRDAYNTVLNTISALTNIPNSILDVFDAIVNAGETLLSDIDRFKNNVTSNWNQFVSRISGLQDQTNGAEEDLFKVTSGLPLSDLLDETVGLDGDYLNIQDALDSHKETLAHLKGIEKYYSLEEQEKTYNVETKSLETTDFESDAEEKQDNVFISRNKAYYEVKQGDTLYSLGNKFFGDYNKGTIIGEANGLKNSDFENDNMIGQNILIPLDFRNPSKLLDNNLVYFKKLQTASPKERQLYVLGNDVRLDANREIIADGTGDISLIYGEECYLENIMDRITFPVGTLNPIHPDWGSLINIGDMPTSVAISRFFDNLEGQALNDPRTEKAFVERDNSDLSADTLKVELKVKPYSGQEVVIDASDIVAGVLV